MPGSGRAGRRSPWGSHSSPQSRRPTATDPGPGPPPPRTKRPRAADDAVAPGGSTPYLMGNARDPDRVAGPSPEPGPMSAPQSSDDAFTIVRHGDVTVIMASPSMEWLDVRLA